MRRTTVTLPDELVEALVRAARRRNVSASEIIRRALAGYLGWAGDNERSLPFANLGHSGHHTTARDMEELLREEWSC